MKLFFGKHLLMLLIIYIFRFCVYSITLKHNPSQPTNSNSSYAGCICLCFYKCVTLISQSVLRVDSNRSSSYTSDSSDSRNRLSNRSFSQSDRSYVQPLSQVIYLFRLISSSNLSWPLIYFLSNLTNC